MAVDQLSKRSKRPLEPKTFVPLKAPIPMMLGSSSPLLSTSRQQKQQPHVEQTSIISDVHGGAEARAERSELQETSEGRPLGRQDAGNNGKMPDGPLPAAVSHSLLAGLGLAASAPATDEDHDLLPPLSGLSVQNDSAARSPSSFKTAFAPTYHVKPSSRNRPSTRDRPSTSGSHNGYYQKKGPYVDFSVAVHAARWRVLQQANVAPLPLRPLAPLGFGVEKAEDFTDRLNLTLTHPQIAIKSPAALPQQGHLHGSQSLVSSPTSAGLTAPDGYFSISTTREGPSNSFHGSKKGGYLGGAAMSRTTTGVTVSSMDSGLAPPRAHSSMGFSSPSIVNSTTALLPSPPLARSGASMIDEQIENHAKVTEMAGIQGKNGSSSISKRPIVISFLPSSFDKRSSDNAHIDLLEFVTGKTEATRAEEDSKAAASQIGMGEAATHEENNGQANWDWSMELAYLEAELTSNDTTPASASPASTISGDQIAPASPLPSGAVAAATRISKDSTGRTRVVVTTGPPSQARVSHVVRKRRNANVYELVEKDGDGMPGRCRTAKFIKGLFKDKLSIRGFPSSSASAASSAQGDARSRGESSRRSRSRPSFSGRRQRDASVDSDASRGEESPIRALPSGAVASSTDSFDWVWKGSVHSHFTLKECRSDGIKTPLATIYFGNMYNPKLEVLSSCTDPLLAVASAYVLIKIRRDIYAKSFTTRDQIDRMAKEAKVDPLEAKLWAKKSNMVPRSATISPPPSSRMPSSFTQSFAGRIQPQSPLARTSFQERRRSSSSVSLRNEAVSLINDPEAEAELREILGPMSNHASTQTRELTGDSRRSSRTFSLHSVPEVQAPYEKPNSPAPSISKRPKLPHRPSTAESLRKARSYQNASPVLTRTRSRSRMGNGAPTVPVPPLSTELANRSGSGRKSTANMHGTEFPFSPQSFSSEGRRLRTASIASNDAESVTSSHTAGDANFTSPRSTTPPLPQVFPPVYSLSPPPRASRSRERLLSTSSASSSPHVFSPPPPSTSPPPLNISRSITPPAQFSSSSSASDRIANNTNANDPARNSLSISSAADQGANGSSDHIPLPQEEDAAAVAAEQSATGSSSHIPFPIEAEGDASVVVATS